MWRRDEIARHTHEAAATALKPAHTRGQASFVYRQANTDPAVRDLPRALAVSVSVAAAEWWRDSGGARADGEQVVWVLSRVMRVVVQCVRVWRFRVHLNAGALRTRE